MRCMSYYVLIYGGGGGGGGGGFGIFWINGLLYKLHESDMSLAIGKG